MSVFKYLGLSRLGTFWQIIKDHGGIKQAYLHFYRYRCDLKLVH